MTCSCGCFLQQCHLFSHVFSSLQQQCLKGSNGAWGYTKPWLEIATVGGNLAPPSRCNPTLNLGKSSISIHIPLLSWISSKNLLLGSVWSACNRKPSQNPIRCAWRIIGSCADSCVRRLGDGGWPVGGGEFKPITKKGASFVPRCVYTPVI